MIRSPSPVVRKLAAILSADVKGYSRLMGEDEVATVRTLTTYREIMVSLIRQHRGRVVDAPGDNLLAEFASAVDAVECAAEIQRELKSRNTELPEARRMEVRIGINLGEVVVEEDKIYGDGVNIAARLEALAEPGGISISGVVYDQVKGKLALRCEPLGEHVVKNIREPIRVYRVVLEPGPVASAPPKEQAGRRLSRRTMLLSLFVLLIFATGGQRLWTLYFSPSAPVFGLPDRPSIAVLPFDNMSGDAGKDYFSDGITEDITTALSKLSGLFVIARNSAFVYKGRAVTPAQVSRELGVRYVLEGSVRKEGNRVRITAQLIDATTGFHLWAERYDRDLRDVFALQDEVTQKIVQSLAVQLTAPEQGRLRRTAAANPEAYDDMLRGMEYYRRTTRDANAEAQRMFRRALDLDPQYARAYAALGWSHLQNWTMQWSQDPETLERAYELAQQAIARDDSMVTAHTLMSHVYLWQKEHDRAITEAERAVALGPNHAEAYETLAEVLAWSGRAEEAIGFIKKAMRLNPQYPFFYLWTLGHSYYLTGRTQEAVDTLGKVLERNSSFLPAHAFLAVLYAEMGLMDEARAEMMKAAKLSPAASLESLRQSLPYKDEGDLERLLAGMRRMGLK